MSAADGRIQDVTVGDILVVRYGEQPCKVRMRIACVARVEPLGVRLAGRASPGFRTASTREFRPRWMPKVHDIAPDAVVRPATRRELVLGHPDPTIGATP